MYCLHFNVHWAERSSCFSAPSFRDLDICPGLHHLWDPQTIHWNPDWGREQSCVQMAFDRPRRDISVLSTLHWPGLQSYGHTQLQGRLGNAMWLGSTEEKGRSLGKCFWRSLWRLEMAQQSKTRGGEKKKKKRNTCLKRKDTKQAVCSFCFCFSSVKEDVNQGTEKGEGGFSGGPWLRLCFSMQRVRLWVQSLVGS